MSFWTRWLKTLAPSIRARKPAARKANAAKKPARRMNVEHLETRLAPAAMVLTDKDDYAPGSTAIMTAMANDQAGVNFKAAETVQFQVTRTDGAPDFAPGNEPWRVTDGVGDFTP